MLAVSLLVIMSLTAPMVHECCLPSPPSGQTCESGQAAIAESRDSLTVKSIIECSLPSFEMHLEGIAPSRHPLVQVYLGDSHAIDLYLRTGALLI